MTGMGSHRSHGNGGNVWLTPPWMIDALGPFDLDPCYGAPRPWPTAAAHYGPEDNGGKGGLLAPWYGMVWCNPPYDAQAWAWLQRCAEHGTAIALIFARTEVEQFHRQVWGKATALLFLEGRLFFHHPDGTRAKHNAGAPSVLVAYGEEAAHRLFRCDIEGWYQPLRSAAL